MDVLRPILKACEELIALQEDESRTLRLSDILEMSKRYHLRLETLLRLVNPVLSSENIYYARKMVPVLRLDIDSGDPILENRFRGDRHPQKIYVDCSPDGKLVLRFTSTDHNAVYFQICFPCCRHKRT